MALTALDNLVRIGQLKAEPRNDAEVQRMLAMAQTRWADAQLSISLLLIAPPAFCISASGQFDLKHWLNPPPPPPRATAADT